MAETAEAPAEVCFINIGPKQRRRRLIIGAVFLAVSAAAAVGLVMAGAPRLARLGLFLPLFAAGVGYFQWREKT
ncbi:MAG TPA: hypothetical protein VFB81_06410 [Myxococcales bacterium]|nr:hypothetical protein [Myxococcales bacterium]